MKNDNKELTARGGLDRRSWVNWYLMLGTMVLTAVGLALSVPPLFGDRFAEPDWLPTDRGLLAAYYSALIVAFAVYLTFQQRQVARMTRALREALTETTELERRHRARLYGLFNVSRLMSATHDLNDLFEGITEMCLESFSGDRASLMLFEKESNELVLKSASGDLASQTMVGTRVKLGHGISGWAAQNQEPLLLTGGESSHPELILDDSRITSSMVVPITLRAELVGVLNVSAESPETQYDRDDLRTLEVFAENAGACIRHMEHIHWLRSMVPSLHRTAKPGRASAADGSETDGRGSVKLEKDGVPGA